MNINLYYALLISSSSKPNSLCLLHLSLSLSVSSMENKFKLRVSRMFRSSFGSCRSKNISDVIDKPVFETETDKNNDFQVISDDNPYPPKPYLCPKPRPFPSICKPRCPDSTHNMIVSNNSFYPRRKVSEHNPLFPMPCPPALPLSPRHGCREYFGGCKGKNGEPVRKSRRKTKQKKKRKPHVRNNVNNTCLFSSSSQDSTSFRYGSWWSSSEDEKEDETETLFSSRSTFSSDSSESLRNRSRRRKCGGRHRRAAEAKETNSDRSKLGVLPLSSSDGKVKDSFAVVKSSSDPYNDFRTSMVEMIIEKQIFSAKDLEQLLQCFLSLNSGRHHRIILDVFTEIWEALFSNWS